MKTYCKKKKKIIWKKGKRPFGKRVVLISLCLYIQKFRFQYNTKLFICLIVVICISVSVCFALRSKDLCFGNVWICAIINTVFFFCSFFQIYYNFLLFSLFCLRSFHSDGIVNNHSLQKYSEIIDNKLNSDIIRLVAVAPLFNCELTNRLPTQFIRPSGIDCTKYSRCSFAIKHIGRFFCVISSSRSFNDCNNSGNQINSHEHCNGLSETKSKIKKTPKWDTCPVFNVFTFGWQMCRCTYRQCQLHAMCLWSAPWLLREFVSAYYSECLTFQVNLNSRTPMLATQIFWIFFFKSKENKRRRLKNEIELVSGDKLSKLFFFSAWL